MRLITISSSVLLAVSVGVANSAPSPIPGILDGIHLFSSPKDRSQVPFKLKVQPLSVMREDPLFADIKDKIQQTWSDSFRSTLNNANKDGSWLRVIKPKPPQQPPLVAQDGPASKEDRARMHFLSIRPPSDPTIALGESVAEFWIEPNGHLRSKTANRMQDIYCKIPPESLRSTDGFIPFVFSESVKGQLQGYELEAGYYMPAFTETSGGYLGLKGNDKGALMFWNCADSKLPGTSQIMPFPTLDFGFPKVVMQPVVNPQPRPRCEQVLLKIIR